MAEAKTLGAPYELVRRVAAEGRLPVPNFAAGGIATPADAALLRLLGAEAVFVGSGVFKSADPARRARAIVRATTHYEDAAGGGRRFARPRRGDARHRHRAPGGGRPAAGARLVTTRGPGRRPGAAGRLRSPRADAARARRVGARGAPLRRPRRPGRRRPSRGREHDAPQPDGGRALVRRPARVPCARRRALRHLRGRDPPRASRGPRSALPRPARRRDRAQRLRPAGATRSRRRSTARPRSAPWAALFIRAPRFRETGAGVSVLGRLRGEPVAVREGRVLAATFHPELTGIDGPRDRHVPASMDAA